MIKRYTQFINESGTDMNKDIDDTPGVKSMDSNKFTELKEEIKKMIDATISKSGGEFNTFKESLLKNPEDIKVDGFINDADVYDFYLKYRNDIDEVLNDIKFYDQSPTSVNAYGLYEFTIKGTEKAFQEIVKMIK